MQEIISVVIPVYNVKPYLDRCIQAVCGQTYRELEIILVDDGATDGSGDICDRYAKEDGRIKVIHQKNAGTSAARNAGLNAATGTYVGFLDADDWPEKDHYEQLYMAVSREPKVKAAQMMSRDFAEDGTLVKGPARDDGEIIDLTGEEYFRELMLHVGDSSFCTKLFQREWMQKYAFTTNRLNEDFELLLSMIPNMGNIRTVGKVGYNIELRGGSNTRGGYKQHLYEAMMENASTAYRMAQNEFPQCEVEARRFWLVQALDFLLHIPVEEMKKENTFYCDIRDKVKSAKQEIKKNPYLDKKQRRNLLILASCPKSARKVHGIIMKMKKQ